MNELVITTYFDKLVTLNVEDGKICQIQAEDSDASPLLGNIYVGKVRNIVKNINAAFVEFKEGQMGYLPLNDKEKPMHTDGVKYQDGRVLIGDEIIVQVKREAVGTKPPTLTGAVEISGRYIVLLSRKCKANISSKIKNEDEKKRLKQLLERFVCDEYGFIARTNSAFVSEDELVSEINSLSGRYKEITRYGKHKTQFTCLHKSPTEYICNVRDCNIEKTDRIITDNKDVFEEIKNYFSGVKTDNYGMSDIINKLVLWDNEKGKLDAIYNIARTVEHALMPKVWLKSGAYLVIQPTEAFVSIDVNTGKAISKKKDVNKTFKKVNAEAAWEIARQLKLRNLSGMIIIDFIDMADKEDGEEILNTLREAVAFDNVPCHVVDITKLGLVEMTRKKVRKPLYEQLGSDGK